MSSMHIKKNLTVVTTLALIFQPAKVSKQRYCWPHHYSDSGCSDCCYSDIDKLTMTRRKIVIVALFCKLILIFASFLINLSKQIQTLVS